MEFTGPRHELWKGHTRPEGHTLVGHRPIQNVFCTESLSSGAGSRKNNPVKFQLRKLWYLCDSVGTEVSQPQRHSSVAWHHLIDANICNLISGSWATVWLGPAPVAGLPAPLCDSRQQSDRNDGLQGHDCANCQQALLWLCLRRSSPRLGSAQDWVSGPE